MCHTYSLPSSISSGSTPTIHPTPHPFQTSGYCCWETRVGQELYRLFWLDFLLEVAEVTVLDFTRGFLVRFRLMCTLSDRVSCM